MNWYSSTRVSLRIVAHASDEKVNVVEPPGAGSAMQCVNTGPS